MSPHGCSAVKNVFQRAEVTDLERRVHRPEERIELPGQARRLGARLALQRGPLLLEMEQHRFHRGQGERVANERTGEVRHPDSRGGAVAELPVPAVERVHVLAFARDRANGQSPADDLSVRSDVRLHAEVLLGAAGAEAEARDDLVEDEHRSRLRRQGPELV